MIAIRKAHPALCCGGLTWIESGTPAVAACIRSDGREQALMIYNLGQAVQAATCSRPYEYRWLLLA